jgi:opacity protein-like surface antigen
MIQKTLIAFVALLLLGSSVATAQQLYGFTMEQQDHKAEIGILGGYVWTTSKDFSTTDGRVNADFKSSGYYGFEADINVRPGMQLVLLWTRQDTDAVLKGTGVPSFVPGSTPLAIEYWQIGALSGMQKGTTMPYGKFTLGGTRYALDSPGVSDEWQFSIILGLGVKVYPSDKIAIRLEGTLPWTYTNGGVGLGFGTGGAGFYVGGNGIAQWTLNAGINVLLGSN